MVDQEGAAGSDAEECAWCKFMKGGPCKAVFEVWQSCVDNVMDAPEAADEASRRRAVEKCAGVTAPLFECLVKHPEYYGPQIDSMAERSKAEEEDDGTAPTAAAAGSGSNSSSSRSSSSSSSTSRSGTVAGVQGKGSGVGQGNMGTAVA